MKKQELLEKLQAEVQSEDYPTYIEQLQAMIAALCDCEALAAMGVADGERDQAMVEDLYLDLKREVESYQPKCK